MLRSSLHHVSSRRRSPRRSPWLSLVWLVVVVLLMSVILPTEEFSLQFAAIVRRAPKAKRVGKKSKILQKQIQVLLDSDEDDDAEEDGKKPNNPISIELPSTSQEATNTSSKQQRTRNDGPK